MSFCEVAQRQGVARRTASSLNGLIDLLGPGTAPAYVAIEACREVWVVHDTLRSWGHEVLVVDTTRTVADPEWDFSHSVSRERSLRRSGGA